MTTAAEPWDDTLSLDDVMALYDSVMTKGGKSSAPQPGCIERSLGGAWTAESYRQDEGGMPGLLFACYVLFYLANNHCFTDGNKRIAWASMVAVLRFHRLTIRADDDEAERLVLDIIGKTSAAVETILSWVSSRLEEASD